MLESTAAYKAAVVGDSRRTRLRAVVDISDPDKKYLPVTASPEAPWSKKEQLHDYDTSAPPRHATLERGRWLGDGSFDLFPDNYIVSEPVGYASQRMSGADGDFSGAVSVQLNFTGVDVLQTFSLYFSGDITDGFPSDFTVEVLSNGTAFFKQEITENSERELSFKGFTVYNPDALRLTVIRWSLPSRHVRITEMTAGYFERWDLSMLSEFSVTQQGRFDCLTLPYGTATLAIDNTDRRFEPRRKDSLFQSIEERQGIDFSIGIDTDTGTDYKPIGRYFQAGDGWKVSQNAAVMKWSLLDIIGLVCNRAFIAPEALPTTLEGWVKVVVSQLGDVFKNYYSIDPDYKDKAVMANSNDDVAGKSCGDIIRWACMATGTWPRAASKNGALTIEPLWSEGNKITLEAMVSYPTMKANESLAALIFQLADGNNTQYVVTGNSTSSEKTVTVQNPFIHTAAQALEASKLILSCYGGNVLEFTGRGNPSSEIGDVDTVWLDESNATTARRMSQTFQYQNGVLQNCKSTLLQADGSYLWTEHVLITSSGTWKAPAGISQLRIVIGQGGQGGGYGADGVMGSGMLSPTYGKDSVSETFRGDSGADGKDGAGGKVWYDLININPEQEFTVEIGAGGMAATEKGKDGEPGGETYFGAYTSANGKLYENGYSDIANGGSFGRTGVVSPLPNSSDGGKGGVGGTGGVKRVTWTRDPDSIFGGGHTTTEILSEPTEGTPGVDGASGFVLIFWDKEQGE